MQDFTVEHEQVVAQDPIVTYEPTVMHEPIVIDRLFHVEHRRHSRTAAVPG